MTLAHHHSCCCLQCSDDYDRRLGSARAQSQDVVYATLHDEVVVLRAEVGDDSSCQCVCFHAPTLDWWAIPGLTETEVALMDAALRDDS